MINCGKAWLTSTGTKTGQKLRKFVAQADSLCWFSKRLTIVTIVQPRYKVIDEKDMSPEFQKIP